MTVAKLCEIVSGKGFRQYLDFMGRDGNWIDTAFLHSLGCAYGVDVVIFQEGVEPAFVGVSLQGMDDCRQGDGGNSIAVPVALVNDYHFWGLAVAPDDSQGASPVDKGELQALVAGLGTYPGPAVEEVGEDDGAWVHTHAQPRTTSDITVEFCLCQALTRWDPFSSPSEEVLEAMNGVQQGRAGRAVRPEDTPTKCLQRSAAITALAYEEHAAKHLPEMLRDHRLAQMWLTNPTHVFYGQKNREKVATRRFCDVVAGTCSVAFFSDMIEWSSCERHGHEHKPGNPRCCGLKAFNGTAVYNWRVLWHSMPWVARKEWLLKICRHSLLDHRAASHLPDDRFQVSFRFLGQAVCRDAFQKLTGLGASSLQEARAQTLEGRVTWSSPKERGVHGLLSNHAKPAAYLGARQWLEQYANTHAEWSPTEARAYLPAGRKLFYFHHYRSELMHRHGLTEEDMADLKNITRP